MIDIKRKYRTRDGQEVRIYCTDGGGTYPVHGAIRGIQGNWWHRTWRKYGSYFLDVQSDSDLIEVPEPQVLYLKRFAGDTICWTSHIHVLGADILGTLTIIDDNGKITVEFKEQDQ